MLRWHAKRTVQRVYWILNGISRKVALPSCQKKSNYSDGSQNLQPAHSCLFDKPENET